jgi:hypothetical protein
MNCEAAIVPRRESSRDGAHATKPVGRAATLVVLHIYEEGTNAAPCRLVRQEHKFDRLRRFVCLQPSKLLHLPDKLAGVAGVRPLARLSSANYFTGQASWQGSWLPRPLVSSNEGATLGKWL